MTDAPPGGLRGRAREAMKASLADVAIALFDEFGFDQVTVNDVAAAADISPRSFFRYFPSKEDVVFGSRIPSADQVRDELLGHLQGAPVWQAFLAMFQAAAQLMDADATSWKRVMRVINHTAGLRARNLEKHLAWADALTSVVSEHLDGDRKATELRARTIVNTALGCFDVALMRWAETGDGESLEEIIDEVFSVIVIRSPSSPG